MVSKKIIASLIEVSNILDDNGFKKYATALDHIWIRLAYGDHSKYKDIKDSTGNPYDFNLEPTSFNQRYDMPHPYDAPNFWDKKLLENPSLHKNLYQITSVENLDNIKNIIKDMSYKLGKQMNIEDYKIDYVWRKAYDDILYPVKYKPFYLDAQWKEDVFKIIKRYFNILK